MAARSDPQEGPVITLAGELDISTVPALRSAVEAATERRPETLTFEVAELSFMDSAGIAVLLGAAAAVPTVRLRGASPGVRRLIELTGIAGVLRLEP